MAGGSPANSPSSGGGGGSPVATDFRLGSKLGQGAFGVVYKATRKRDGAACVIKQVNIQRLSRDQRKEARNEVAILQGLDHKHVVKYLGSFEDPKQLSIGAAPASFKPPWPRRSNLLGRSIRTVERPSIAQRPNDR